MGAESTDLSLATCLLFTPANRLERLEKAATSGADGVIVDLEDAVALDGKDAARAATVAYFQAKGRVAAAPFVSAIRVNHLHTEAGLRDLLALRESRIAPDAIVLPKVESAEEIRVFEKHLDGPQAGIRLIPLIETATGLERAFEIARAGARVGALALGGADLAAELGAALAWEPLLFARSRLVQAAAAAGIGALDVPYLDVRDDGGLRAECERAKALGFTGKLAIHPKHAPIVVAALRPDAASTERARRVVEVFEASAGNACEIDGKMIDLPVYRAAKRVLALAQK
jgi:(S)-citramalyl-CoA lyase